MKLQNYSFLTDENIHPEAVEFLCQLGCDVLDVKNNNLIGTDDLTLIKRAFSEDRIILTHDNDFGKIAIGNSEPIRGIVYIRPGHIKPEFIISVIEELFNTELNIKPPFIIVAERTSSQIKIRIRNL